MKTLVIVVFTLLIVLSACTTEPVEFSAQQLTVQELNTSPGYAWFPTEVNLYAPNTSMVDSVRTTFDASTQKVAIFVKPGCSCRGTMRLFPQIMKTLIAADVDMSKVEVWSMRGITDKHPYQPTITITDLPSVYVFRNNVIVAEVHDGNYSDTNADTLIATALAR
ncbi:MAG: hypothetical protein SGJ05_04970 [bacterium]|nr:hypothetical protein [bacterium]